jgi:hypothetical protein
MRLHAVWQKSLMTIPFAARDFECPVCGAVPQGPCKFVDGSPRSQSHPERYDIALEHQARMSEEHPDAFKKPVHYENYTQK